MSAPFGRFSSLQCMMTLFSAMLASTVDTVVEFIKKSIASDGTVSQGCSDTWRIPAKTRVTLSTALLLLWFRIDEDTTADGEGCSTVLSRRKKSRFCPLPWQTGLPVPARCRVHQEIDRELHVGQMTPRRQVVWSGESYRVFNFERQVGESPVRAIVEGDLFLSALSFFLFLSSLTQKLFLRIMIVGKSDVFR